MTELDEAALRAQTIAVLRELMLGSDSDPTRATAAKILLERLAPKDDEDARRREAEERAAAIAEARCLLAELAEAAAAEPVGAEQPPALAENGAAAAVDAER